MDRTTDTDAQRDLPPIVWGAVTPQAEAETAAEDQPQPVSR